MRKGDWATFVRLVAWAVFITVLAFAAYLGFIKPRLNSYAQTNEHLEEQTTLTLEDVGVNVLDLEAASRHGGWTYFPEERLLIASGRAAVYIFPTKRGVPEYYLAEAERQFREYYGAPGEPLKSIEVTEEKKSINDFEVNVRYYQRGDETKTFLYLNEDYFGE